MKILIIDNNIDPDCWGSKDLCRLAKVAPGATIVVRRAPQEDLPHNPLGFDRVIVSGSKTSALADEPWIDQLFKFIRKTIDSGIPYLGVCYGHQALVRAVGGDKSFVRLADSAEFGWTKISLIESNSLLMRGVPNSFYSFSAHFEEVSDLPQGMKRLAFSEDCSIQACQLENRAVYGIQFHPEKSVGEAKKILQERKKKKSPPYLLNPDRSDELYDPKLGETLFKNFLQL